MCEIPWGNQVKDYNKDRSVKNTGKTFFYRWGEEYLEERQDGLGDFVDGWKEVPTKNEYPCERIAGVMARKCWSTTPNWYQIYRYWFLMEDLDRELLIEIGKIGKNNYRTRYNLNQNPKYKMHLC